MGEIDFSEDINLACGQCTCWQLIVWKHSGHNMKSDKIQRFAKAVGIQGPLNQSVTHQETKQHFKAANAAYHFLKPNVPMI
jgi:hypothetical protein